MKLRGKPIFQDCAGQGCHYLNTMFTMNFSRPAVLGVLKVDSGSAYTRQSLRKQVN